MNNKTCSPDLHIFVGEKYLKDCNRKQLFNITSYFLKIKSVVTFSKKFFLNISYSRRIHRDITIVRRSSRTVPVILVIF